MCLWLWLTTVLVIGLLWRVGSWRRTEEARSEQRLEACEQRFRPRHARGIGEENP